MERERERGEREGERGIERLRQGERGRRERLRGRERNRDGERDGETLRETKGEAERGSVCMLYTNTKLCHIVS